MALELGFSGRKLGFRPGFVEKHRGREEWRGECGFVGALVIKEFLNEYLYTTTGRRGPHSSYLTPVY